MPIDFGSDKFYEGDLAQANCVLRKGDLPVMFQWIFNDQPLVVSDSVQILNIGGRTSLLTISPIHGYHQGNFTCIATNSAGTARVDASFIVYGILYKSTFWGGWYYSSFYSWLPRLFGYYDNYSMFLSVPVRVI